jgi:hypothetical protein
VVSQKELPYISVYISFLTHLWAAMPFLESTMKITHLFILSLFILLSACNDTDSETDIDVYISSGKLMCQDNALPLIVTKSYLLAANIAVKSESCGYLTEVAFAEICGGATGELHIFTIDESDAMLAENIGFTLPDSQVIEDNYDRITCDD